MSPGDSTTTTPPGDGSVRDSTTTMPPTDGYYQRHDGIFICFFAKTTKQFIFSRGLERKRNRIHFFLHSQLELYCFKSEQFSRGSRSGRRIYCSSRSLRSA